MTASSPTKPGVLMGTVAYMSPEQVQAQPVDARSDLFSFGVVLYELLARKHPFRRDTVAATLTAILQETPRAAARAGCFDPARGGRDRAAVPGEGPGRALPGRARPGARPGGGAPGADGLGLPAGSRGALRRTRGCRASRRRTRPSSSAARTEVEGAVGADPLRGSCSRSSVPQGWERRPSCGRV